MSTNKIIERIKNGGFDRAELFRIRKNAKTQFDKGDTDAKTVIDAIDQATPLDRYFVFMGFCPGADFKNRLDVEWKEKRICRFDFTESKHQLHRFNEICAGDLVILKKREKFGETMRLFGHGRVSGIAYDEDQRRYLLMDWSKQTEEIEVPLMACNSTVDVKSIEQVDKEMPEAFFNWLKTV